MKVIEFLKMSVEQAKKTEGFEITSQRSVGCQTGWQFTATIPAPNGGFAYGEYYDDDEEVSFAYER